MPQLQGVGLGEAAAQLRRGLTVSFTAWILVHLLVGAVGAGLARGYARRRSMVDHPGERRSHAVPTPRGGGVAIAVSLLLATVWMALRMPEAAPVLAGFGAGLALVALVGWLDDHRPLSPWFRLAVHVVAGAIFASGAWLQGGDLRVAVLGFVATVALVNVWNFMDGIDGLATTQAILVVVVPMLLAGAAGLALGLALVAAALGFLPWNFPRARVFLGDVGSGALGFAVGGLVVMAVADAGPRALALSLLPLSACLVDAGITLCRRILRRERWWEPHVSHAYQHAARRHGHPTVTIAFGAWTLFACAAAWAIHDVSFTSLIISLLAWYLLGAAAWWSLQVRGAMPAMENRE